MPKKSKELIEKIIFNKEMLYWSYFLIGSLMLSSLVLIFFQIPFLTSLQIILGTAYVLFLPGHVVVREFFNEKDLDWIEKAALCFGLSIALVILSVMLSNLIFKIPITALTNFLVLLVVMIVTLLIKKYEHLIKSFLSRL
jgi:uncharacterized membrane protein